MKKKNKSLYVVLILIILFGVSVGYAAISRVLTINGNSEVKQNTWDIHFENIQIKSGSVTATKEPTLENSNTTVNFSFMLDLPGDYYEFTVDAVNKGTIDAMIDSITKTPELTTEQAKYLNYIIEYQTGEQIASKQLVSKDSFVRIKVRVEYKTDITEFELPTTSQSLALGFTLNYVQADSTATSVKDNGVFEITANGSLDDIGTIVTIGSEQFYTIGTEGDNVKLLAMYNLYVGGSCEINTGEYINYGSEATGMQDENMKGYMPGQTIFHGVINYKAIALYLNNYKDILERKFAVEIKEARLITIDELTDSKTFACSISSPYCKNSSYSWVYSTSYWTESSSEIDKVWNVDSRGYIISGNINIYSHYGIRPVIVIPKSYIKVEVKPIADGDINEIGTIVTIGSEQFYTIGTEGDNVKLLSMYNLYVGNEITDVNLETSEITMNVIANPTGMQNAVAKGMTMDSEYNLILPFVGTTAFSSDEKKGTNYDDYHGSIVEGYVNNYKTKLEDIFDVEIVEARLITKEELTNSETFACNENGNSCDTSAYPWIYSTSYWTNSAIGTNEIWNVDSTNTLRTDIYSVDFRLGVRPVIVIHKSLFQE